MVVGRSMSMLILERSSFSNNLDGVGGRLVVDES
jgi:hypothetical protein